jgi:hypothetical protein
VARNGARVAVGVLIRWGRTSRSGLAVAWRRTPALVPCVMAASVALAGCAGGRVPRAPAKALVTGHLASVSISRSGKTEWAVGATALTAHALPRTLIVKGTARVWVQVTSPSVMGVQHNSAGADNELTAVSAVSAGDAWAVGYYTPYGRRAASSEGESWPLILHWNGSLWTRVRANVFDAGWVTLDAVSADAANNVWVVGAYRGAYPRVFHWNGATWQSVSLEGALGAGGLYGASITAVQALGSANVWMVGSSGGGLPLALHFNGVAWESVAVPRSGAPGVGGSLTSVTIGPSGLGWASGVVGSTTGVLDYWNGKAWSSDSAAAVGASGAIRSVSVCPSSLATGLQGWAVGGVGSRKAAILKLAGPGWTPVATPRVSGGALTLNAVVSNLSCGGEVVGSYVKSGASPIGPSPLVLSWISGKWVQEPVVS